MTFTTKTIRSNYLNKEFEVSCWALDEGNGRILTIIEHAALEDIIYNKISGEENAKGFSYTMLPVIGVVNYPVMQCVMSDSSGRKIISMGAAHPDSLVNAISRNNEVVMASNRAFDRAAIRYLNLEGKVYSSEEIPENESFDKTISDVQTTYGNEMPEMAGMIGMTDSGDASPLPKQGAGAEIEDHPETSVEHPEDKPGDVVINFGKYRGKNLTVAQICETDDSWVNYTINMNTDKCGDTTKKQIAALKAYRSIN